MVDKVEVTAAEIARLANVGRAAVSNWRRRYENFPEPVGGTETSPTFSLSEIRGWLDEQGKLSPMSGRELVWQHLEAAAGALPVADRLAAAGAYLAGKTAGKVFDKGTRNALDALAAEEGPEAAFEQLCDRFIEANSRGMAVTPRELGELMVELASPLHGTVFDPACGVGGLLSASVLAEPRIRPLGQEQDGSLAQLAVARLGFGEGDAVIRVGDSLRDDAFPDLAADTVVSNPPFNLRNWGSDDLAYDPRWAYGLPPKGESELAWVQHCLAHLRPGGRAVLLMPPAVASRRSGRPIRAELLRRGALRAVIALPAGAAPPLGLPLQLWVLEQPAQQVADTRVLFVDTTAGDSLRVDEIGWPVVRERVQSAWSAFQRGPATDESPRIHKIVPVIELLDDDVDVTPARHLRSGSELDVAGLSTTQRSLTTLLGELSKLLPEVAPTRAESGHRATASIAELQRSGALSIRQQTGRLEMQTGEAGMPVLTARDVVAGQPPSGRLLHNAEHITVRVGDVVVPVVSPRPTAVVIAEEGAALGPNLYLLRPDRERIDPWFLAGFLRSRDALRFASTMSGTHRLDVRKVEVPRVPLDEQRRYAEAFRMLAEFDDALNRAATQGRDFTQSLNDGLAAGALAPVEK